MPAVDDFSTWSVGADGPATHVFTITPHDTNELDYVTRAIRANTAGVIRLASLRTGANVDCNFAAGETRPIRTKRVLATGTTATGIEGMC